MTQAMFLEDFETVVPGPRGSRKAGPNEDWLAGYLQAQSEAADAEAAEGAARHDAIVQMISDMTFRYAEARDAVLTSLEPLFDRLVRGFLPDLAEEVFVPRLVEQMMEAAGRDTAQGLVLTVSPGALPTIEAALADEGPLAVTCKADATIGPLEAQISGMGIESTLDVEGLREACVGLLAAVCGDQHQSEARA